MADERLKLFVGNLTCPRYVAAGKQTEAKRYDTTEDDLRATFSQHGELEFVRINTDRNTGKPAGCAATPLPTHTHTCRQ